jgi:transcriptional regulator with XRE-family HTH domain
MNPLKKILKQRKIKKSELAKEIGISPSELSHILKGRRRLGVDKAIKFSKATGIPVEEFFR